MFWRKISGYPILYSFKSFKLLFINIVPVIGVIILVVICGLISGNLDNLIRPRLVGKDAEMHDLFILFGTLGGISMFGILGIIVGPIIAALFSTVWQIYGDSFKEYLPAVGNALAQLRSAPEPESKPESESEKKKEHYK